MSVYNKLQIPPSEELGGGDKTPNNVVHHEKKHKENAEACEAEVAATEGTPNTSSE